MGRLQDTNNDWEKKFATSEQEGAAKLKKITDLKDQLRIY